MIRKSILEEVAPQINQAKSVNEVCSIIKNFLGHNEDKYIRNFLKRLQKCSTLEKAQSDFYTFILAQSGLGTKKDMKSIERDYWPIPGKIWGD